MYVITGSSRHFHTRGNIIHVEHNKDEIAEVPEEEEEELSLIYQAKGMPEADARSLAKQLL